LLAELQEEGCLTLQLDPIEKVPKREATYQSAIDWVGKEFQGIKCIDSIDCDTCRAEMVIKMALDAPTEASAVAHWDVVTQCGGELCKFAKVLSVKLESVDVAGEELEIAYI
jgi:hypothetical protein